MVRKIIRAGMRMINTEPDHKCLMNSTDVDNFTLNPCFILKWEMKLEISYTFSCFPSLA